MMMIKTNGEDRVSHMYEDHQDEEMMMKTSGEDNECHLYEKPTQEDGSAMCIHE